MMSGAKKKPTWNDLKYTIGGLDRDALLGLVHDLYAAHKENKTFLHARFGLGDDVLEPYKATISRWVCPDVMRNQDYSVSKAKKAVSDYKKAVGHADGLAELSVYYCESCRDFLGFCSVDDEVFFNALVRMFEQALKWIRQLDPVQQEHYLEREQRHGRADGGVWICRKMTSL
jgi:hypothetical protein